MVDWFLVTKLRLYLHQLVGLNYTVLCVFCCVVHVHQTTLGFTSCTCWTVLNTIHWLLSLIFCLCSHHGSLTSLTSKKDFNNKLKHWICIHTHRVSYRIIFWGGGGGKSLGRRGAHTCLTTPTFAETIPI